MKIREKIIIDRRLHPADREQANLPHHIILGAFDGRADARHVAVHLFGNPQYFFPCLSEIEAWPLARNQGALQLLFQPLERLTDG
ncbi:hypothetical protein D3C71_1063010 [compost metagenome]